MAQSCGDGVRIEPGDGLLCYCAQATFAPDSDANSTLSALL
jgi:hypothetical protein